MSRPRLFGKFWHRPQGPYDLCHSRFGNLDVSAVGQAILKVLQSCSFARNISGIPSSSLNTLFDRSPLVDGCDMSFDRAASSGTGLAFGAAGVGIRASDEAVMCSAV
jgi:hypothetical protein